jgi:GNAT superfamily N-acetyltransferase
LSGCEPPTTAVLDNLFALFRSMAAVLPGGELEESELVSRHHAFPSNPMFKAVWGLGGSVGEADEAVVESLAWLESRGAPFAFVVTGSGYEPEGLPERLGARLLTWDRDSPAMVAELDRLDWDALERVPDGLAIERVRDDEGLGDFARMFVEAFGAPEPAAQAWVDATKSVGIEAAPWQILVARLRGEPVATTIVWNGAGVASVFAVGTVEAARGQGIGAAITLAGFDVGRSLGFRHGVLFSTELGLPVYRRIGLRETGSGVSRWLWRAG